MVYFNNTSLAFTILKKLVKNGVRESIFPFDSSFTEEEINLIESLAMTSNDSFYEISKLNNLKSLAIIGMGYTDSHFDNSYEEIFNLNKLEKLSVQEVINIYNLDLTNLTHLKKLILINNYNLNTIPGLCDLKNLNEVVVCGNGINSISNPISYVKNTSNSRTNILDVILFATSFPRDSKARKFLATQIYLQRSNIKFGEMLEFNRECYTLNYSDMVNMSAKSKAILSRLELKNDDKLKQAKKINDYIIKIVKYDTEGLNNRTVIYNSGYDLSEPKNEYQKRQALVINSSQSAIMSNLSVCDGYVNAMRLLLSMINIESRKVLCSAKSNDASEADHVIIKFRFSKDSEWIYADPEGEQRTGMNFFGLSYNDISKTHKLFDEEIIESGSKVYKYEK